MSETTPIQRLGIICKKRRQDLQLSHQLVANVLGINTNYIIDLEAGKIKSMPLSMLYSLAYILHLRATDLLVELKYKSNPKAFYQCFIRTT